MPRTGAGEQETGGENVLSVARECRGILSLFFCPLASVQGSENTTIAIFTQSDLLVNKHHRKAGKQEVLKSNTMEVMQRIAEEDFKKHIEPSWLQKQIPCVRISAKLSSSSFLTERF